MQHDWFMYHLRSTYENCLDFPFKRIMKGFSNVNIKWRLHHFISKSALEHWYITESYYMYILHINQDFFKIW